MPYTRRTGGEKEFHYTKEDMERIESEDTESTRIFKDALRKHRNRPIHRKIIDKIVLKKKKQKTNFFIIMFILSIIVLIVIYQEGYLDKYSNFNEKTETVTKKQINPVIVEEKISFQNYLENYKDYDEKSVTLTGFLSRGIQELGAGGVYVESIVDDYGNDIKIIQMNKELVSIFPKIGITKDLYNVSGHFDRRYKGLDLKPTRIVKADRNTRTLEEKEIKEIVSIGTDKQISFNFDFDRLFNDIKDKIDISCKEDERWYIEKCIPRIECSDGTLHPSCSSDKPKQCVNGNLINNISKCGCGWDEVAKGNECVSKNLVESQEATEYVNKLRKQNGRSEIKWDERVYNLGLFRTKDMYDRNYFDHVDPDGKCANSYKSNYELGGYTLAENAGAVTYGYNNDYDVDYASYADPIAQIDGWMDSRGHRYNLLYVDHKIGAVVCYKGACVFLGAHTSQWGLGAGPCSTGAEGTAYWQSVGKQPGEV